jgi:MFS family permease
MGKVAFTIRYSLLATSLPGLTLIHKSVESRASWVVAGVSFALLGMSFGAPWITAVGLKAIAADTGGARSVPALANAFAWLGTAVGGILMGRLANRFGIRFSVMTGSTMICIGLLLSSLGEPWLLWLGHGLFIGLLGNGGLNAPLYVYISRWFDRRRGSALALISGGGYLAGMVWPPIFERGIALMGWRWSMIVYALLQVAVILPLAALFLRAPPEAPALPGAATDGERKSRVLGWSPNLVFLLIGLAAFMCCVTMSMPQGHLVALCTDYGISASLGALMLSVLLGAGLISRQIWGFIADRIGALFTALTSSILQAAAMTAFIYTTGELGLFTVSLVFGIGFSALIPAYVLLIRELFPVSEAHWRVPTLLFMSGTGMATGGWLAGYLYDQFGYYGPAFAVGVLFNLVNLAVLTLLALRQRIAMRIANGE